MRIDNTRPVGTCVKTKLLNETNITMHVDKTQGMQVTTHRLSAPCQEVSRYTAENKEEIRTIWDYVVQAIGNRITQ